jgi:hypothetical protein
MSGFGIVLDFQVPYDARSVYPFRMARMGALRMGRSSPSFADPVTDLMI